MKQEGCGNFTGPYPCCSIITGDAKILAKEIPDESVDLIFTDPVYDKIEDYEWLAEMATRVLKDDRACLTFCGIGYLPETLDELRNGGLKYRWQLILHYSNRCNRLHCDAGYSNYVSCLWMEKGMMKARRGQDALFLPVFTNLDATGGRSNYYWGKPIPFFVFWLQRFMEEGVTLDPFCGGGTSLDACMMLGGHYLGFEIDPEVAEKARERVRNTQPPLFVVEPEQAEMKL